MAAEFVHLHVHSEFSMLDGAIRIPQLVENVDKMGMPAVALTDNGNTLFVSGFWDNNNVAIPSLTLTGTVVFNASGGPQAITAGGNDANHQFNNVTFVIRLFSRA